VATKRVDRVTAKVVIYEAFIEGKLEAPKHLARTVHDLYFDPKYEDFLSRTVWSLSNAFTSAFKELEPIPHFKATAQLGVLGVAVPGLLLVTTDGKGRTADLFITPFAPQAFRGGRRFPRPLIPQKSVCGHLPV
jgi:hypothetical protein